MSGKSSEKGKWHYLTVICSLLCLFLSEKKTMPPRKMRAEDPMDAKRMKKKKRMKRRRKADVCVPECYQPFGLLFSLKKERVYFFRTLIGVEDSPGRYQPFAFPFSLKKDRVPLSARWKGRSPLRRRRKGRARGKRKRKDGEKEMDFCTALCFSFCFLKR